MGVRLSRETTLQIDHADMAAILTDQLCGYNALAGLEVECVAAIDEGRVFQLTLIPKAEEPA